jgi:hypothetical protein
VHFLSRFRIAAGLEAAYGQCSLVRGKGNLKSRLTSDKHVWQNSISENTMKKLLSIGLLTVCALALHAHQANAWVNAKFSVGLNWQLQSANNNVLWGAWKNGQVPGPEAFGGGGSAPFPQGIGPGPMMTPPGAFPYFGQNPQGAPQSLPVQTVAPPQANAQTPQAYYGMTQGYYNPYQTVSYQPSGYYYPNYYYPIYQQYYGYQAPSYWYQGR